MNSKLSDFSTILDPAIIAKLQVFYSNRDLNLVQVFALICSTFDEAYDGMTAGDVLSFCKQWKSWTPERRWAMCKLFDLMVTHGMQSWVKVGENDCGENLYRILDTDLIETSQ